MNIFMIILKLCFKVFIAVKIIIINEFRLFDKFGFALFLL